MIAKQDQIFLKGLELLLGFDQEKMGPNSITVKGCRPLVSSIRI